MLDEKIITNYNVVKRIFEYRKTEKIIQRLKVQWS